MLKNDFDVGHALDHGPWTGFQKWVLVLASFAFAVDGLSNQVLGVAIPDLVRAWGVSRGDFAPVRALGLIGVTIGASVGGALGDRIGRRAGLIGTTMIFGVATLAGVVAHSPSELLLLQFIAGLGIGGALPNGAALVADFTPLHSRSWAISLAMVFIAVGGVLTGLAGALVLERAGWRGVFVIGGVAPILTSLLFLFALPESPRYWLDRRGAGTGLLTLLARCGLDVPTGAALIQHRPDGAKTPLSALLGRGVAKDTLAIWSAFFFCLLASYTMFSWVPSMLQSQGFGLRATSLGSSIFNVGGVTGGVLGGWLIQRSGSKLSVPILALGGVIGALVLGLGHFGPSQGMVPLGAALFVEGIFIAGLHNGMYTLAAHAYPAFARGTGVGAAAGIGRLGAVVSSYTGVLSLQLAGASGYFVTIAGAVGLSLISVLLVRNQIPPGAPAPVKA